MIVNQWQGDNNNYFFASTELQLNIYCNIFVKKIPPLKQSCKQSCYFIALQHGNK